MARRLGWLAAGLLTGLAVLAVIPARAQTPQPEDAELAAAAAQELADLQGGKEPGLATGRLARAALQATKAEKRARALALLAEVLREPELARNSANVARLQRWQKQARSVVARSLEDPDVKVRAAALKAARALSNREATEGRDLGAPLTQRVRNEPDATLRAAALELALELELDAQALQRLGQIAARDADPAIRARGQELLATARP